VKFFIYFDVQVRKGNVGFLASAQCNSRVGGNSTLQLSTSSWVVPTVIVLYADDWQFSKLKRFSLVKTRHTNGTSFIQLLYTSRNFRIACLRREGSVGERPARFELSDLTRTWRQKYISVLKVLHNQYRSIQLGSAQINYCTLNSMIIRNYSRFVPQIWRIIVGHSLRFRKFLLICWSFKTWKTEVFTLSSW
jgi:hypothetical protein